MNKNNEEYLSELTDIALDAGATKAKPISAHMVALDVCKTAGNAGLSIHLSSSNNVLRTGLILSFKKEMADRV